MTASPCPAFGFRSGLMYRDFVNHSAQSCGFKFSAEQIRRCGKTVAKVDAISKVLGYIPLIGAGIGIWRLHDQKEVDPKGKIGRAVVEILGIGIVLLPVDVIATAIRTFK